MFQSFDELNYASKENEVGFVFLIMNSRMLSAYIKKQKLNTHPSSFAEEVSNSLPVRQMNGSCSADSR